ncbi:unnamed protein product [Gadus morhua 'NCC']
MCSVLEEKYRPAALQATLAKSCLLDPRYRGNNFDEYAEEETKCALINEMLGTEDRESGASASAADQPESLAQTAVPPPTKKRTLGDLLKSRTSTSATVPKRARADLELTRYLQEEPIDSNDNPLACWIRARNCDTRYSKEVDRVESELSSPTNSLSTSRAIDLLLSAANSLLDQPHGVLLITSEWMSSSWRGPGLACGDEPIGNYIRTRVYADETHLLQEEKA